MLLNVYTQDTWWTFQICPPFHIHSVLCSLASYHTTCPETSLPITTFSGVEVGGHFLTFATANDFYPHPSACKTSLIGGFSPLPLSQLRLTCLCAPETQAFWVPQCAFCIPTHCLPTVHFPCSLLCYPSAELSISRPPSNTHSHYDATFESELWSVFSRIRELVAYAWIGHLIRKEMYS